MFGTIKRQIEILYRNELLRFLFVGGLGLISDALVLHVLHREIGLIPAKIISYIVAFTVTWLLNRWLTFQSEDPKKFNEWTRYALLYAVTGGLHVLIFAFFIHEFRELHQHPIGALIITAIIIAFGNFFVSKRFVFRQETGVS